MCARSHLLNLPLNVWNFNGSWANPDSPVVLTAELQAHMQPWNKNLTSKFQVCHNLIEKKKTHMEFLGIYRFLLTDKGHIFKLLAMFPAHYMFYVIQSTHRIVR